MDSTPFTVVIPLYNKAGHIVQTLASVLAQRSAAAEIIVVDDGSTDDGADIVAAMKNPLIRLVRQANGGVSRARNRGIREAHSPWITFLDADDYLHPDFLSVLSVAIRRNPAADVVATQYKSVPYDRAVELTEWPVDLEGPEEVIEDLPSRWLRGTCFFTSSVAVKLERLKSQSVWFPEGEAYGEDLDLWFRLAEQTPVVLAPAPLVARIWVPGGLSTLGSVAEDPPYVCRMLDRANGRTGSLSTAQRGSLARFLRHRWVSLARTAISSGDRPGAVALLGKSRRYGIDKRWILTAVMVFAMPARLVYYWQHWRKRRRMILG